MSCGCEGLRCSLSADDPRHGTQNAYGNYKCRCDECRKANARYYMVGKGANSKWKYKTKLWQEGKTMNPTGQPRQHPYKPRVRDTEWQHPGHKVLAALAAKEGGYPTPHQAVLDALKEKRDPKL